ncbi:signal peptidase II [Candidatus Margulisiibacteriota bacterium]
MFLGKKYSILIIIGIIIDQTTKVLANTFLKDKVLVIFDPFLSLPLVHNYGAAYGILQNQRWLLLFIGFSVLIFCIIFHKKLAYTTLSKYGLSFLLIGTAGNLIDRFFRGYVIDFINIRIFPVFNFADVAIDIGIFLFILDLFLSSSNAENK